MLWIRQRDVQQKLSTINHHEKKSLRLATHNIVSLINVWMIVFTQIISLRRVVWCCLCLIAVLPELRLTTSLFGLNVRHVGEYQIFRVRRRPRWNTVINSPFVDEWHTTVFSKKKLIQALLRLAGLDIMCFV